MISGSNALPEPATYLVSQEQSQAAFQIKLRHRQASSHGDDTRSQNSLDTGWGDKVLHVGRQPEGHLFVAPMQWSGSVES